MEYILCGLVLTSPVYYLIAKYLPSMNRSFIVAAYQVGGTRYTQV